jgi:8-oxo-dGTP diphosphatase
VSAKDGDGWVECACGQKHWGKFGASGIALIYNNKILLQHRAAWVHNGDTWGIPGGARDSDETAIESALREAKEEIGIDTNKIKVLAEFLDNHGTWSYTTIISTLADGHGEELSQLAHPSLHNEETKDLAWFDMNEVEQLNTHPSFAKSWPKLLAEIQKIFI